MKKLSFTLSGVLFLLFVCVAQGRELSPLNIPVPDTVSPELRSAIEAGQVDWWQTSPKTAEEWKAFQKKHDADSAQALPWLEKAFHVSVEQTKMGSVPVYIVEPEQIAAKNRDRVLLHLHGGGYVLNAGASGIGEAVFMAGIGKFRVISVDYRMPPDFPYPAALDDAMKVYRALLEKYPPSHIGVFGTSTGGGLTLALVLKARQDGLPLPGAIAAGTPWSDMNKIGDSYFTNEHVDNILVSYDGWVKAAAKAYANGHDLKDPLLSPVYGDVSGFPPTFLGSGTRDLFLSNTVRMQRKLLEAGVPTELLVLEGISHAQYMLLGPNAPEAAYYYGELTKFFDKYLK